MADGLPTVQKGNKVTLAHRCESPFYEPDEVCNDPLQVSMETFMGSEANLSPRMKMNQHNNDAGRLILASRRERKCKCHGVSSSCTVKTCWESLPTLGTLGRLLKEKYSRATEVKGRRRGPRAEQGGSEASPSPPPDPLGPDSQDRIGDLVGDDCGETGDPVTYRGDEFGVEVFEAVATVESSSSHALAAFMSSQHWC